MASEPEPSVDPQYLIKAVRSFVGVSQPADTEASELGWEEAGSLVWDSSAMADDAAFLLRELPELPGMLAATLTATAAAEQWRAVEIGIGILGNLACHAATKQHLLDQEQLPELLMDKLLWIDDAAALAELLRALAAPFTGAGMAGHEVAVRWWALLLRDETLGRLVWIVENTLSTALLERSLNLLAVMVGAVAGAAAASDRTKQQMVPQLLSLDLLQLLASVLTGWLVRLHAEEQQFGGGSKGAGKRKRVTPSPGGWGGGERQRHGDSAAAGAGEQQDEEADPAAAAVVAAAAAASPDPEAETPAELASSAVVAAEVSEAAALEALALLEALAAVPAGEQALNCTGPVQHALVRTIAESENRGMQALSTVLLAGLQGAGAQLLQHLAAVGTVLARLAEHAQAPVAGAAGDAAWEQQAEEVEAGWALCSALAGAVSQHQEAAAVSGKGKQQEEALEEAGPHQHHAARVEEVLGVVGDYLDVLCAKWGGGNGVSLARHQAYVLARLGPLLAARPGVGEAQQAALRVALERCKATE